jgi:glycosyltransferase involved in cell wall biosynthesis
MSDAGISVSVVFPMYNEKEYIRDAVRLMSGVLDREGIEYEILIVDDASTDGSGAIADELSRAERGVRVIHNRRNRKLGGALKEGFRACKKGYILYADMDLPFDFSEVTRSLHIVRAGEADIVTAYRLNRDREGFHRKVYTVIYRLFLRVLFGLRVRDVNFAFKLMRTSVIRSLHLSSEGSFIGAEIMLRALREKARIVQFGTRYFSRRKGRSHLSTPSVIAKILFEAFLFRVGLLR